MAKQDKTHTENTPQSGKSPEKSIIKSGEQAPASGQYVIAGSRSSSNKEVTTVKDNREPKAKKPHGSEVIITGS